MTLSTMAQVCDQYAWLYTDLNTPDGTWDHVFPVDGAFVAVKVIDGQPLVCWRGSVTAIDWIEDFTLPGQPFCHPLIGPVHPGFLAGVERVYDKLNQYLSQFPGKPIIVGHSLGAGHAAIYAALRVANGMPVDRVIMFGEPRAGCAQMANVLANTPIYSFRNEDANGHDYVTDVPAYIPGLAPYTHPRVLTDVHHSPAVNDVWGLFRYHHFGHYCAAFGATGAASKSLPAYNCRQSAP